MSVHAVAGWLLLGSSDAVRQEWRRPTTTAERTVLPQGVGGSAPEAVAVVTDVATAEEDEQFELFLSVDPNIADVGKPRVVATILDDD